MMEETWEQERQQRKEKAAEVEKRTLAFEEHFEAGNLTEEEYQHNIKQELDYAEPMETWVPIEDPELGTEKNDDRPF